MKIELPSELLGILARLVAVLEEQNRLHAAELGVREAARYGEIRRRR